MQAQVARALAETLSQLRHASSELPTQALEAMCHVIDHVTGLAQLIIDLLQQEQQILFRSRGALFSAFLSSRECVSRAFQPVLQ